MNPSATQQHHARSMMYLIQARGSPDTYLLSSSYNNNSFNLSFSGGGRRQHFSFQQR